MNQDPATLKSMDSAALVLELLTQLRHHHSADTAERVERAARDCVQLHAGQTRANRADLPRTPYDEHPLRNTLRIIGWGNIDPVVLTSSLLHDVPEDCADRLLALEGHALTENEDTTEFAHAWVEREYGADVSAVVRAVTNPPKHPGASRAARNAQYVDHVAQAVQDPRAFLVKAADFADNAGSLQHNIGHVPDDFIMQRIEKYEPVAQILEDAARLHTAHGVPEGLGEPGFEAHKGGTIPGSVTQQITGMVARTRGHWVRIRKDAGDPKPTKTPSDRAGVRAQIGQRAATLASHHTPDQTPSSRRRVR